MTNHNTDKRLSHFTTLKWHEYVKKLDKTFLIHKGKAILSKKKKSNSILWRVDSKKDRIIKSRQLEKQKLPKRLLTWVISTG